MQRPKRPPIAWEARMSPRHDAPPRRRLPGRPAAGAATRAGRRRRDRTAARLSLAFGAVIVVALPLLGGVALAGVVDHDWHAGVTLDGTGVSRADGGRIQLLVIVLGF
jgi:hypothetical protein